jgi:hypothetical protein
MSAQTLLASTVLNSSASLMNDTARTVYHYAAQLPYLRLALQELQEYYELNSIPVTEDVSAVINMPAGSTEIVYDGVGVPTLPSDMILPLQLWERTEGIDPYIPMVKVDFLPLTLAGVTTNQFGVYVWQGQKITVPVATADNDIKIQYNRELFPDIPLVDENTILNIVNAASFLQYRTAALCAEFIERNMTSAGGLNTYASLAIDRAAGIDIRGKQNIMTRRRPFRAGYKRRGWVG